MSRQTTRTAKAGYHHGDLRRSLMEAALQLIREQGIEQFSLRKLAERVGVSQTALYHHFRDKQALLYALGETGIDRLTEATQPLLEEQAGPLPERMERFVHVYVRFALENPELYELMFSRTTWKQTQDHTFHKRSRQGFRAYSLFLARLQAQSVLPPGIDPLRLAQVSWATMHGICHMYNDGLAFKEGDVEEISQYALKLLGIAIGLPPAQKQ